MKESKAQRVERLKREKNPWECLGEIRRFAQEGYASIPPEWLGTYFRVRHADEELRPLLEGRVVAPASRDASPGRPPHGVDG
jgi:hypothetical protein